MPASSSKSPAVRRALSVGAIAGASLFCLTVSQARAADFTHAQKIYVPASKLERRFDYDSLRARASGGGFTAPANNTPYTAPPPPSTPSKSGLVPPPPAIPVTITGSGSAHVPPPPPTPQLVPGPALTISAPPPVASALGSADTSSISQARARAQQLIKQGKLDDADLVLRGAHKAAPRDALVNNDLYNLSIQRARKYLGTKDIDSATKASREALYLNPSSNVASDLLNQALRQSGVNPLDPAERVKLADKLASQGRDTAALVEYKASLKLKPSADAHVGLGNMQLRNGQKSKAKEEYQLALETDPNSGPAHRQMGLLKLSSDDVVGANTDLSRAVILNSKDKVAGKALIDLWQKQVAKNPNNANSHLGLARAYQLVGDLKSSHAAYREVVRIDPEHPNLPACRQSFKLALARQEAAKSFDAAHTLEAQGALADAHGKVSDALNICPTDSNYRLYQGHLLEKLGQYQQARETYLGILKEDPQNLEAAKRLQALPSLIAAPLPMPTAGALAAPAAITVPGATFTANQSAGTGLPAAASTAGLAGLAGLAGMAGGLGPFVEQPPAASIPPAPFKSPITSPLSAPAVSAPGDHVGNLSNFLTQLRNQSMVQQKQDQATERAAQDALDKALSPPSGSGSSSPTTTTLATAGLAGLAGLTAGAATSSSSTPSSSAPSSIDDLNKLLGKPAGAGKDFAPPVVNMPDLSKILKPSGTAKAAAPATSRASTAGAIAATAAAPAALTAVQAAAPAAMPTTPTIDPMTYQRLLFAEQQNRTLSQQLQQAHQALQQYKQNPATMPQSGDLNNIAPPSPVPAGIPATQGLQAMPALPMGAMPQQMGTMPQQISSLSPQQLNAIQQQMGTAITPEQMSALQQQLSATPPQQMNLMQQQLSVMPPQQSNMMPPQSMPYPITQGTPVKLELEGISPTSKGLQLKVVLKNDQDSPLAISKQMDGVVRSYGLPDTTVQASFKDKKVPAHGQIHGTINIPTRNISPTSDLVLPNLLPPTAVQRDVHLTAAMRPQS